MHFLFLSGSLKGLAALTPYFVLPIALIIAGATIPAMRYLYKNTGHGNKLVFFLLAVLNLVLGLMFVGIIHDANPHLMRNEPPKSYLAIVGMAYLCGAVMTIAGGLGIGRIIYRIYKWAVQALKERME